jgi:hypothetical protein
MKFRDQVNNLGRWTGSQAQRLQAIPRAWLLVAMTALLIGIGLLLVQTAMAQRVARDRAMAEADAQVALQNLNQSLVDAESGQRGYLRTPDPSYLDPYNRAIRHIPAHRGKVPRNMADGCGLRGTDAGAASFCGSNGAKSADRHPLRPVTPRISPAAALANG